MKWFHKEYFRLIDDKGNNVPDDPVFVDWMYRTFVDKFEEKENQEPVRREAIQTDQKI